MPANRIISPRLGRSQKVSNLTDTEFRVWVQYLLAADDFGIMPLAAAAIQSGSHSLASKPATVIRRCLEHIISIGLVLTFEHQGQTFVYQADWQDYQKVKWPAKTINPAPPLETLSDETRWLFQVFPGGKQVPKRIRGSSVEVPSKFSDGTSPRHQTLIANSTPLTANSEESARETAGLDISFEAFKSSYPAARRVVGMSQRLYFEAVSSGKVTPEQLWVALQNHIASEQWQNPRLIPNMQKWFEEQRWEQVLPAAGASRGQKDTRPAWMRNAKTVAQVEAEERARGLR